MGPPADRAKKLDLSAPRGGIGRRQPCSEGALAAATLGIKKNAGMAARRVRLYWDDGTVETPRQPIDAGVTMFVRQAKDGTHSHIARELPDDRRLSLRSASDKPSSSCVGLP